MDENHNKVGANGQLELFGRRRGEIPDAERVEFLAKFFTFALSRRLTFLAL